MKLIGSIPLFLPKKKKRTQHKELEYWVYFLLSKKLVIKFILHFYFYFYLIIIDLLFRFLSKVKAQNFYFNDILPI